MDKYIEKVAVKYGEEGKLAIIEFITFGKLDSEANTPSERDAWETMWCIFKNSTQGKLALRIVGREGDW